MLIKYLIDKTVCYLIRRGPITPMLSAPSSHHRRVSSGEWWRDHIAARNTNTGHHRSVGPMFKQAEKHPGNVTSQSPVWLESKKFSSTLICSDQNFCPGRGGRRRGIQKHLKGMYLVNSAIYHRLQTSVVLSWTQVFYCQHGHMELTHTQAQANRLPRLRHQNKPICQNFHSNYEL